MSSDEVDPAVSQRMRAQRTADTDPEVALRRELHALGLRYRLHMAVLEQPRRLHDIVFIGSKIAVDVHGCFWHGCPEHYTAPQTHSTDWARKVEVNRARDAETPRLLSEAGWDHIVVWEHEDPEEVALRIRARVAEKGS